MSAAKDSDKQLVWSFPSFKVFVVHYNQEKIIRFIL